MIREKLDAGMLPLAINVLVFTGYGSGRCCDGCEEVISPGHVEHEYESADGQTARFHLECAGLWEAERRRRGSA